MAVIAKIRKHAGLAVTLIGVAIIGFVVQDAFGRRGQKIPPLAVINGETVSYNQFEEVVEQVTAQYQREQGMDIKLSEEDIYQIRGIAWQRVLSEYLINGACQKTGLDVTGEEMNDMYYGKFINRYLYPVFTDPQTGIYDRQRVKQIIQNPGQLSEQDQQSWREMEKAIKQDRMREKYYTLAMSSYYMPDVLAQFEVENQSAARTARYVVCPYSQVSDQNIKTGKADYKKFYNNNKYRFRQTQGRAIRYVVFDVEPTPEDMDRLHAELDRIYTEFQTEENIPDFVNAETNGMRFDSTYLTQSEILPGWDTLFRMSAGSFVAPRRIGKTYQMAKLMDVQMRADSMFLHSIVIGYGQATQTGRSKDEAQKLADSLVNLLNANPALFASLASQFSDDPSAAQTQGEIGWVKDGMFPGFINKKLVATSAGKACQVEVNNGFFVYMVDQKTAPVKKVLAAIITLPVEPGLETVKDMYTKANQLLGACKGRIENLDSAAAKMNLMPRQFDRLTELTTAIPGANSAREVVRWAYNKDTKPGRVADHVFEMENRYVVAGLVSINSKDYTPLKDAMKYRQREFDEFVTEQAKHEFCVEKTSSCTDLNELAGLVSQPVDTAMGISITSYPLLNSRAYEPEVIGTICGLQQGQLSSPVKGNYGTYRIVVDEISNSEINPIQVQMFKGMKENQFQQAAGNYIGSAMEKAATIKDNRIFYF